MLKVAGGGSSSNGTVTNIATGTGLTGGPITTTGTISMVTTTATLGNTAITLGQTTTSVGNLTLTNVTIPSGTINVQVTNHTSTLAANATYAIASLPLQPAGFVQTNVNGVVVKVPYYAV